MYVKLSRAHGFTLVEIMVVVAIISMLAAIAIPNFVRARQLSQTSSCLNNLREIDGAKDQFALEIKLGTGDACTMSNIVQYLRKEPFCPVAASGGGNASYNANVIGTRPQCTSTASTNHNTAYTNP